MSEFAQMSSQQLLKETQRAAGDENLSTWHRTLIESGKELKTIQDVRIGCILDSYSLTNKRLCSLLMASVTSSSKCKSGMTDSNARWSGSISGAKLRSA